MVNRDGLEGPSDQIGSACGVETRGRTGSVRMNLGRVRAGDDGHQQMPAALEKYDIRASGLGKCGGHWVVGVDIRGDPDEADRSFVQDGVPVVLLAARDVTPLTDAS